MFEEIEEFIKGIDEYQLLEKVYHKKVRPEFFTHDEICYHIETLVSLECHHRKGVEKFVFFEETTTETIGEELEVDLEDFIDFSTYSPEYKNALNNMKTILMKLTRGV